MLTGRWMVSNSLSDGNRLTNPNRSFCLAITYAAEFPLTHTWLIHAVLYPCVSLWLVCTVIRLCLMQTRRQTTGKDSVNLIINYNAKNSDSSQVEMQVCTPPITKKPEICWNKRRNHNKRVKLRLTSVSSWGKRIRYIQNVSYLYIKYMRCNRKGDTKEQRAERNS